MKKILTIDVGGTFIKYAVLVGTRVFKIAAKGKVPTPKKNHEEFLEKLAEIFKAHNDVGGIAVSMPGLIDTFKGVCISSGALDFCNGHCVAEELQKICGVPVTIENDANCAALAEVKSGSLVGVKDAFVLVFGTGIGGAVIRKGELYRGAHFCAGEVSFMPIDIRAVVDEKNFCANDYGAVPFQKSCAKILGKPSEEVTGEMIFDLIEDNNAELLAALHKFAHGIAAMIFNLQVAFDPERFALGGGISIRQSFIDAVQYELDELYKNVPDYLPRPEVVACKYHNDANLFGALYRHIKKQRGVPRDKTLRH